MRTEAPTEGATAPGTDGSTVIDLTVRIERIAAGPALVIEDPVGLADDFFRLDASSAPGGYDDQAGKGDPIQVTLQDIVAINRTMRARSPHAAWDDLILATEPLPWLVAIDPAWDLIDLDESLWQKTARPAAEDALRRAVAKGRGLSVATKVLHLKRPQMFPVLDSLVLQNLGVTEKVTPITIVDHLRQEGRQNRAQLRAVQQALQPSFKRTLVRILDALLWVSHPAAGLGPSMGRWEHVVRASSVRNEDAPATAPARTTQAVPSRDPTEPGMLGHRPTFDEVFGRLQEAGSATVISSRGTRYVVTAQVSKGTKVIVARPRSGQVRIHEDCWGDGVTCQRTRAGGIYNGDPSIFDWYESSSVG